MKKKLTTPTSAWSIWAIVGVFVILLYFVYRTLLTPAQVAEIGDSGACTTNVSTISIFNQCGNGLFRSASYTCANSPVVMGIDFPECASYSKAFYEAQQTCGSTCVNPSSTPNDTPVITPFPYPTPTPTPIASRDPIAQSPFPTSTPAPTATATPTPLPVAPSGCYYKSRLCIDSLIGGSCSPNLVCEKPNQAPYLSCYKSCRLGNYSVTNCLRSCMSL